MRRRHRLDQITQDLSYGLRTLRRQPAFTLAAVLTLAFGIGATASILSIVSGVMIRPLPYPNADRVVVISQTGLPGTPAAGRTLPFSAGNFVDLRTEARAFEGIAAFRNWSYNVAREREAELVSGARVSAGWFEVLGVKPALGRSFEAADELVGSEPVVIIGEGLWRRRYGGERTVLGRRITLNGQYVTVVGIMPRGFGFPRGPELPSAFQFGPRSEIWTPLVLEPSEIQARSVQNLLVIGLPRPGRLESDITADLDAVMGKLAEQYPGPNENLTARTVPLLDAIVTPVRPALLVLLAAVSFLLLIACFNVSNLLLTRTAARSREVAVRAALGAGRGRLFRQFMVENVLLVSIGGIIGIGVAAFGKDLLLALAPTDLPRRSEIDLDWRVVGGIVALMLMIGLALGVLVGSQASGDDRFEELREGAKGGGGRSTRRLRQGLVVLEVAISVMLLSGAGLLGRTFLNLRRVAPGIRIENVLTAQVSLPRTTSDFSQAFRLAPVWARFFFQLRDELAAKPGVRGVGVITTLPLTGAWETSGFIIAGQTPEPGRQPNGLFAGVSDGYFEAMGIPVLEGRVFDRSDRDSTAARVVVSQAMAGAYWPGRSPIGERIQVFFGRPLEVIGVVGDVHHRGIGSAGTPAMYFPFALYASPNPRVVVATTGAPQAAAPVLRQTVGSIDPTVPVTEVMAMEEVLAESLAQQRMSALLMGGFAAAALGLAVIGLYGVLSFGVARRVREIGIRLALGAPRASVLGRVVREGGLLSLAGIAIGLAGAVALGRLLSGLVFGVGVTDAATLGAVSTLLFLVALTAALIPARRAMGVDPVTALRQD